jgi:hypothetical protein
MLPFLYRSPFVSDGPDLPGWRLRVLDYVGLGFLLLVAEEVMRRPKVWYSWTVPLAIGVVLLWLGDAAPTVWKWLIGKWRAPKALAIALAENASLKSQLMEELRDNSDLRDRLDAPRGSIALPPPSQAHLVKPQHNVQYVEFKSIHSDPFFIAALCFQNVPTGRPMGKFESPRLRVIYYEHSTGQEIADLSPIAWWDSRDGITDISAEGRDADIASHFEGKWEASETYSDENTLESRLHSVALPFGEVRIVAYLFGNYEESPAVTVRGILTLGEEGWSEPAQQIRTGV